MTKAGRPPCNANSSMDVFQRRWTPREGLCWAWSPRCPVSSFLFDWELQAWGIWKRKAQGLQIRSFIEATLFGKEEAEGPRGTPGSVPMSRAHLQQRKAWVSREVRVVVSTTPREQSGTGRMGTFCRNGPFFCPFPSRPAGKASSGHGTGCGHQRAAKDAWKSTQAPFPRRERGKKKQPTSRKP